jgi:hypothetical protein
MNPGNLTIASTRTRAKPAPVKSNVGHWDVGMPHRVIKIRGAKVKPHKAFMDPNFDAPTAIVTDPFAYVELWLKRYADLESRLYWRQAGSFYSASAGLPYESRAVTAYYSMLNAAR